MTSFPKRLKIGQLVFVYFNSKEKRQRVLNILNHPLTKEGNKVEINLLYEDVEKNEFKYLAEVVQDHNAGDENVTVKIIHIHIPKRERQNIKPLIVKVPLKFVYLNNEEYLLRKREKIKKTKFRY